MLKIGSRFLNVFLFWIYRMKSGKEINNIYLKPTCCHFAYVPAESASWNNFNLSRLGEFQSRVTSMKHVNVMLCGAGITCSSQLTLQCSGNVVTTLVPMLSQCRSQCCGNVHLQILLNVQAMLCHVVTTLADETTLRQCFVNVVEKSLSTLGTQHSHNIHTTLPECCLNVGPQH